MKLPFVSRNRFARLVIVTTAVLLFIAGPAFCSSGGEGAAELKDGLIPIPIVL